MFRSYFRCCLGAVTLVAGLSAVANARDSKVDQGRELFLREWTPGDDRTHGGDGLGPVYNDSSCIACHNAGGAGGGGPSSKNVDIITAVHNQAQQMQIPDQEPGFLRRALGSLIGLEEPAMQKPVKPRKPDTTALIKAHAGFRTARSVVLHKFGNDAGYDSWRIDLLGLGQFAPMAGFPVGLGAQRAQAEMVRVQTMIQFRGNQTQGQAGPFALLHSQRNPTALFGAGLIDSIPASVLESAAKAKYKDYPEVAGRVSRQKDGRIGRFGWKAQTPSLEDFVLTACAVELGLEVPGHHQGGLPQKPAEKAKGFDLSGEECASLVAYVSNLPKPVELQAQGDSQRKTIEAGRALFAKVGCTTCHSAKLGDVEGIYSDLLVHDMGPELGDVGQYGVFDPNSSEEDFTDPVEADGPVAQAAQFQDIDLISPATPNQATVVPQNVAAPVPAPDAQAVVQASPDQAAVLAAPVAVGFGFNPQGVTVAKRPTTGPASRQEWRTPPLWGFRDSGPYLHDGRADTLEQTVALHGGEGARSAQQFFTLSASERLQLQTFLKSLTAPME